MGRVVGWTLGIVFALAISVAPAAAETRWSVGVHIGSGPVYYPPVYRERVYYPPPVYRERVYRPVYRERVIVVERRHDNGKHKGWYKHDKHGRGDWRDDRYDRDWRDDRYDRDRRW